MVWTRTLRNNIWESSIDRMVSKGAFEAALKHAGDDVHFQERVVNALVAAGELEYARTILPRPNGSFSGECFRRVVNASLEYARTFADEMRNIRFDDANDGMRRRPES